MLRARQGVVVVVEPGAVDLGLGPPEDPEGVVGAEVGQGEGDGARPGGEVGRVGGEEDVADEEVVRGVGRGVDAEPVEAGGGVDAGPSDPDRVAGFGEDLGGDGQGGCGFD